MTRVVVAYVEAISDAGGISYAVRVRDNAGRVITLLQADVAEHVQVAELIGLGVNQAEEAVADQVLSLAITGHA